MDIIELLQKGEIIKASNMFLLLDNSAQKTAIMGIQKVLGDDGVSKLILDGVVPHFDESKVEEGVKLIHNLGQFLSHKLATQAIHRLRNGD